jgi:hypothetical protein
MRVRVNTLYTVNLNGWDILRPCQGNNLKNGQVVRVINLPAAPPANTMGQCYVADLDGKFLCMVSTGSLQPLTADQKKYLRLMRGCCAANPSLRFIAPDFVFEPASEVR